MPRPLGPPSQAGTTGQARPNDAPLCAQRGRNQRRSQRHRVKFGDGGRCTAPASADRPQQRHQRPILRLRLSWPWPASDVQTNKQARRRRPGTQPAAPTAHAHHPRPRIPGTPAGKSAPHDRSYACRAEPPWSSQQNGHEQYSRWPDPSAPGRIEAMVSVRRANGCRRPKTRRQITPSTQQRSNS